ncbi:putative regulatory protein [Betalipothrixvirus acidiani]|uniref:Regulatory protein n=1 Tax=Betalipothrixvirus acidiani TaxID=346881 RepID=A7WKB8_9VIRU|nr:transcriptional regulator [Acidianus filamentous virus 3]CAJ31519.1 putative regulatory protein [Acidianus filamentous virus 3]
MELVKISVRFNQKLKLIFDNIKPRDKTNDGFLRELFSECSDVVEKVSYDLGENLRPYCLRLSPELIEGLDHLGEKLGLSRSEVIRRLIYARAKRLC